MVRIVLCGEKVPSSRLTAANIPYTVRLPPAAVAQSHTHTRARARRERERETCGSRHGNVDHTAVVAIRRALLIAVREPDEENRLRALRDGSILALREAQHDVPLPTVHCGKRRSGDLP